jgi:N6-L-threonylcarbamoyladenine synthase
MLVLGIETSCDETAVALLSAVGEDRPVVVAERISSQVALHAAYGGVVPELAAREHLKALPWMIEQIMREAGAVLDDVELVAVTRGPGLKGCLLIGCGYAKALALARGMPILGVNHIEGHLLAPRMDNPDLEFPYLALVVSGGHTEILVVRGVGLYELINRTNDDAAGEAFDKSANLLGLDYPGGARLAGLADRCVGSDFVLPRVMRDSPGISFSGLKTAISLLVAKQGAAAREAGAVQERLAWAIQDAIVGTLVEKLDAAVRSTGIRHVVVTGGVSANRALRHRVAEIPRVRVYLPRMEHCTDNAAMIGFVGAERYRRGERGCLGDDVKSRWPVETMRLGV